MCVERLRDGERVEHMVRVARAVAARQPVDSGRLRGEGRQPGGRFVVPVRIRFRPQRAAISETPRSAPAVKMLGLRCL